MSYELAKKWEGVKGGKYYLINTPSLFEEFLTNLKKQVVIAVDTETSGLDWVKSHVAGIVIGWGAENNFYIPVGHTDPETGERSLERQLSIPEVYEGLSSVFLDENVIKLFWNAKYDLHVLKKAGFDFKGILHDGLVKSYLVDENDVHKLKEVSCKYIDSKADKWEKSIKEWRVIESRRRRKVLNVLIKELASELSMDHKVLAEASRITEDVLHDDEDYQSLDESKKNRKFKTTRTNILKKIAAQKLEDHYFNKNSLDDISYDLIPLDIMTPYACADIHYTYLMYKKFIIEVGSQKALATLYLNEMELTKSLFDMEHVGVKVDKEYLKQLGPKFTKEIKEQVTYIHSLVGREFNVNSNDEVAQALIDSGCKLRKLTKKSKQDIEDGAEGAERKYSVDKDVLENFSAVNKVAEAILDYRVLSKLKSTYVDSIIEKLDKDDYLHTTFNQNVKTGRMSSSGPNIQNISAKDGRIRRAFVAPDDDNWFVFIDFSQIELRLMAHYSQDPGLLSCYPMQGEGRDVHSLTCSEVVLEIPYEDFLARLADKSNHDPNNLLCECTHCVADYKRKIGKTTNFAIIYGAGKYTLQTQVSTPDRIVSVADCDMFIKNYMSKYSGVRHFIKNTELEVLKNRFVTNAFGRYRRFPDIHKLSGPQKWRAFRQAINFKVQGTAADLFKYAITRVHKLIKGTGIKLVNVVHDEIQFYVPKNEVHLLPKIKEIMEDFRFTVPITVEVSYSEKGNWADKVEGYPPGVL